MRFTAPAAAAILATAASAQNDTAPLVAIDITNIVDNYVTVCAGPTVFALGANTYTVTSATTFTVPNCPCTVTSKVTPYVVPTTCVVPSLVTYCPVATTYTAANTTYKATAGQTLTVPVPVTVTTKTTLTPGVAATSLKLIGSSLLSSVVYTPGPSPAVAPAATSAVIAPPKPTAAAFTGAAARNEILGGYLNNLF